MSHSLMLSLVLAMHVLDSISFCMVVVYIPEMVASLSSGDAARDVEKSVGLLIGTYAFFETVCLPFWGYVADRIGRKPVMLLNLAGQAIAPLLFGLSTSLRWAFVARSLHGIFSGNWGVLQVYVTEIDKKFGADDSMNIFTAGFSIGMVIGPALGGALATPSRWAPDVFAGTVFDRFPYLLPNFVLCSFTAVVWVASAFLLGETHSLTDASYLKSPQKEGASREMTWYQEYRQFLISVVCGAALSAEDVAWNVNLVLIVTSLRSADGNAYGPFVPGALLSFGALGNVLAYILYSWFTKRFGYPNSFTMSCFMIVAVTLPLPAFCVLAEPWRCLSLAIMVFMAKLASGVSFPISQVWMNDAAQGPKAGTLIGLGSGIASLCRALIAPFSSYLMSVFSHSDLPFGRYISMLVSSLFVLMASLGAAHVLNKNAVDDSVNNSDDGGC